jgi:hypothetical protein
VVVAERECQVQAQRELNTDPSDLYHSSRW